jgi:serine/threonine protein kinase
MTSSLNRTQIKRDSTGQYAILQFRVAKSAQSELAEILPLLIALESTNVLRVFKFVMPRPGDESGVFTMTTEYCGTSLYDYLHNSGQPIVRSMQLSWANGIACGMKALHAANILHLDLATRNVLLTPNNITIPKVFSTVSVVSVRKLNVFLIRFATSRKLCSVHHWTMKWIIVIKRVH